jgi:hypothetical protein
MQRRSMARLLVVSALACFSFALLVGTARATTVQNQNSSSGGSAISGNARVTNTAVVNVGPSANSSGGPAQASQIGSNSVSVSQHGVAKSGDAVVGSQITGIVGGGDATVQNQNASSGGTAISGDSSVDNFLVLNVGPTANAEGCAVEVIETLGGGPSSCPAQASQIGHNDVVISQSAHAISGDAVVNSQVTGIVGGWNATVQGQNSADGGFATSGTADATNAAGPSIGSGIGPIATSTSGAGMASQNGDNVVDVAQDAFSESGDGVSGSQVNGIVGDQTGFATVRETQAGF